MALNDYRPLKQSVELQINIWNIYTFEEMDQISSMVIFLKKYEKKYWNIVTWLFSLFLNKTTIFLL